MGSDARWIDLGTMDPLSLHAAYAGFAECQAADAPPALLWGRSSRAHVSIGPSQSAEQELDRDACAAENIEIIQRPLGGGTVLVDGDQHGIFMVIPGAIRRRPADFIRDCLGPVVATYRSLGIDACIAGNTDVWCGDAKIAGSGAATIGRSMVFGLGIVERFSRALFCRLIAAPSGGFRAWLQEALTHRFKSWIDFAAPPTARELASELRRALTDAFGWHVRDSELSVTEREAMIAAKTALRENDFGNAPRQVRHGIKINATTYLTETGNADDWLRLLAGDGRIARIGHADGEIATRLQILHGHVPTITEVFPVLASTMSEGSARQLAGRIEETACLGRNR